MRLLLPKHGDRADHLGVGGDAELGPDVCSGGRQRRDPVHENAHLCRRKAASFQNAATVCLGHGEDDVGSASDEFTIEQDPVRLVAVCPLVHVCDEHRYAGNRGHERGPDVGTEHVRMHDLDVLAP